MLATSLKALLEERLPDCEFIVEGNDGQHFQAVAIGEIFAELKTPVKKQQYVMQALKEEFANQEIHALSLKTYTPEEWQQLNLA